MSFQISEPLRSKKIALVITAQERKTRGGPSIRIYETCKFLKLYYNLNVDVIDPSISYDSYDILHFFNVWPYQDSLNNLMKGYSSLKKIIFSPIYMPLDEFFLISSKTIDIVNNSKGQIDVIGEKMRSLYTDDIISKIENNSYDSKANGIINKMLMIPDSIVFLSNKEKTLLSKHVHRYTKSNAIYNPVKKLWDSQIFKYFPDEYSIKDYVLCVGRIEPRKNQLLLSIAMRDANLPLVLIGNCTDPFYLYLIRKYGPKDLVIIDHVDHDSGVLESAYKEAKVFCLPSWIEGAPLSALEAASFGCQLVLSDRASEKEYFDNKALYCDPSDPIDIKNKVIEAYGTQNNKNEFSMFIRKKYSYDNHVEKLVNVYEDVL